MAAKGRLRRFGGGPVNVGYWHYLGPSTWCSYRPQKNPQAEVQRGLTAAFRLQKQVVVVEARPGPRIAAESAAFERGIAAAARHRIDIPRLEHGITHKDGYKYEPRPPRQRRAHGSTSMGPAPRRSTF